MAINRRQTKDRSERQESQQKNERSARPKEKTKGSLILALKGLLEGAFSHKGIFWLGVTIALLSFFMNYWFYVGLMGVLGLSGFQAYAWGFAASFGTSLFEVAPKLERYSRRLSLHALYLAGSRPQRLPNLNGKTVADADQLMENYTHADKNWRSWLKTARYVCIVSEVILGMIFLGRVGTGLRALGRLVLFTVSIFGIELGVTMAVRAGERELPSQVREQLDEQWNNANQRLSLN
jgi:hypothetical protein